MCTLFRSLPIHFDRIRIRMRTDFTFGFKAAFEKDSQMQKLTDIQMPNAHFGGIHDEMTEILNGFNSDQGWDRELMHIMLMFGKLTSL